MADTVTVSCRTCRHWDQRYAENRELGVCLKMGVLMYGAEAAIVLREDDGAPTTDVQAVRTVAGFACIGHMPSHVDLSLRDRLRMLLR